MNNSIPIFGKHKPVIAMIHVQALPGTPAYQGDVDAIIESALQEARMYRKVGIDVLMIENMHDRPYLNRKVGPEVTAMMTRIGAEIKRETGMPCGIQILAGANQEALAAAQAAGLDFIRAEGFVFAHIADEGEMQSDAASLLRYRKQIGAEHILVFTDVKKKHSSHAITGDVDLIEMVKAAEFFLSDGVIITGSATGQPVNIEELKNVKNHSAIPVLVGSGVDLENIGDYFPYADAFIVGSYFKKGGVWSNPLDQERIFRFMEKIKALI